MSISEATPYTDLLHRINVAQVGRCTCVTKTPDPAFHRANCVYRVLADAAAVIEQRPFDPGPWRYWTDLMADQHVHRYFIESDDFQHDVRLYVNGDFADDAERALYAAGLVACLNAKPDAQLAEALRTANHWRSNHDQMVHRLRLFTQREDLPVDRIPAYQALIDAQDQIRALTESMERNRQLARAAALEDVMAMLGARATLDELADYLQGAYSHAMAEAKWGAP